MNRAPFFSRTCLYRYVTNCFTLSRALALAITLVDASLDGVPVPATFFRLERTTTPPPVRFLSPDPS